MPDRIQRKHTTAVSLAALLGLGLGPSTLVACDKDDNAHDQLLLSDDDGDDGDGQGGDGQGDDEGGRDEGGRDEGGDEGDDGEGDEGPGDEGPGEDGGGVCGNGIVDDGEACDDGNADNTDDCTTYCQWAVCGDGFVWAGTEECDDGDFYSIPWDPPPCEDDCTPLPRPCNEDCTVPDGCYWDIEAAPLPIAVHDSNYWYGDIAFDQNCDLVATGADTQAIYRISHVDGSVSAAAVGIPVEALVGVTSHPDGRMYVTTRLPDQIWALETDDAATLIADLPDHPFSITIAPDGFGGYGGQLIWGGEDLIWATDPATGVSTAVGGPVNGNAIHSDLAFAPDGTLYVLRYKNFSLILTMTSGGAQSIFTNIPHQTEGLLFNADGTELFVAHNPGHISSLTIPDAVFTEGPPYNINGGSYPTGMVFDSAGRLIYFTRINGPEGPAGISSIIP